MAKLIPGQVPAPIINEQGEGEGNGMGNGSIFQPAPFAVIAPNQSKSLKAGKKASAPKSTALRGEAWFKENFSGNAEDVVQIRRYPNRREGFHCPPCGIAGSNGIVIRGKDGKGDEIALYEVDPETRELRQTGAINGYIVGETCLKKYGGVSLKSLSRVS